MQIAERCVVSFHYTLTDANGQVIDSSEGNAPLTYLHGAGNIVPGLESAMTGRQQGDRFDVTVSAVDGYGERDESMLQQVPRAAFQGVDELAVGMNFQAQGPQGVLSVVISAIEGDTVTVDANHPLAGQDLHFAIEVVSVRDATLEETLHGHVHGEGGVHHH